MAKKEKEKKEEGDARTYLVDNIRIQQEHVFEFAELYKRLFQWFEVHDFSFSEREYQKTEKGPKKELLIGWEADKPGNYVHLFIKLTFHVRGLHDVEMERNGLKMKAERAELEIRLSAYYTKDPGGKFRKTWGHIGRTVYEKRLAKTKIEQMEIDMFREVHLLIDEIKAFMSMHSFENLPN